MSEVVRSFCRPNSIKNILNTYKTVKKYLPQLTSYCTNTDQSIEKNVTPKKTISKAMKAYIERAKEYDEFMNKQNIDFQIGKRHLANMMGEDPETFTQENIDDAIAYLFPSGLFEPRARPVMRPPEEIFPLKKAAEFDETGRPFHFLFYTGKPNFYKLLHDTVNHMHGLNKYEDSMIRKQMQPDNNSSYNLSGSDWISKENLEKILVERVSDKEYGYFTSAFERLAKHPYSAQVSEVIDKYRVPLMSKTQTSDIPKLQYTEDGRAFITTYECLRKRARGHVTIWSPGSGKISINGKDITYFADLQPRSQVSLPFRLLIINVQSWPLIHCKHRDQLGIRYSFNSCIKTKRQILTKNGYVIDW